MGSFVQSEITQSENNLNKVTIILYSVAGLRLLEIDHQQNVHSHTYLCFSIISNPFLQFFFFFLENYGISLIVICRDDYLAPKYIEIKSDQIRQFQ